MHDLQRRWSSRPPPPGKPREQEAETVSNGPTLQHGWHTDRGQVNLLTVSLSWCIHLLEPFDYALAQPDADERFRTLGDVFRIRNQVAHGRTKTLNQEVEETGEMEELRRRKPQEFWEERSTLEFAEQAYEHTASIIRQLHAGAGRDDAELRRLGHSYSIERTEELAE